MRHPVLIGAPHQVDEVSCLHRAPEAAGDIGDLDALIGDLSVTDDGDEMVAALTVAYLALFAWLLALHPTAAGRVYAAYGGVYVGVAIIWLMLVDKVQPTVTDWVGVAVSLAGMTIIMFGPRTT